MLDLLPSEETLKYAAAFGSGALIIFFFANRRVEQLSSFPTAEEYQPLRLLTVEALAGRRAYRRAFVYYCFLLQLIYILFCVLQPVAHALVGSGAKAFKFDDVAWPLGAALGVVGVLPATPVFEQIELAFRKFAHRAAGIPEGFLASISKLEQSNLKDGIIADTERYADETERFRKVKNVAVAAGFPASEAEYLARADLFLSVFYGWTLSAQVSTIWSANARTTFSDVMNVTSARVIQLREDISQLIKLSIRSSYLERLSKELKNMEWDGDIDPKRIRDSKAYEDEESRQELLDRWKSKEKAISQTSRQLIAMFVLLAANDDRPSSRDPHFIEAVRLAWREQSRPLYNASVIAVAGGFLTALCIGSVVSSLFEYKKGISIYKSIDEGVNSGALTAANMAVQFITAMIVAFAIYYSRGGSLSSRVTSAGRAAPVLGRVSIFLYSALSAAAVSLIVYITYQLWTGDLTDAKALNSKGLAKDILFIAAWSIVPGLFALGCVVLADLFAQKRSLWGHMVVLVALTTLSAFVLLILGRYDMAKAPFWTSMAAVFTFSAVGVWLFRRHARPA